MISAQFSLCSFSSYQHSLFISHSFDLFWHYSFELFVKSGSVLPLGLILMSFHYFIEFMDVAHRTFRKIQQNTTSDLHKSCIQWIKRKRHRGNEKNPNLLCKRKHILSAPFNITINIIICHTHTHHIHKPPSTKMIH